MAALQNGRGRPFTSLGEKKKPREMADTSKKQPCQMPPRADGMASSVRKGQRSGRRGRQVRSCSKMGVGGRQWSKATVLLPVEPVSRCCGGRCTGTLIGYASKAPGGLACRATQWTELAATRFPSSHSRGPPSLEHQPLFQHDIFHAGAIWGVGLLDLKFELLKFRR
jgi:hypothetical protein